MVLDVLQKLWYVSAQIDRGKAFETWGTDFVYLIHKIVEAGPNLLGPLTLRR